MQKTNSIGIGQVVISKAGRDKGEWFFVIDILNEEYILIANGKSRSLEKPKKKKVKHIQKTNYCLLDFNLKIKENKSTCNAFLRKQLQLFFGREEINVKGRHYRSQRHSD